MKIHKSRSGELGKSKNPSEIKKCKLRKGDLVRIIAGKHKGHEGPIKKIIKENGRVQVEGITVVKHVKPKQDGSTGGIENIAASVHISNVALIDPKNKKNITKIGYEIKDNKKIRIARSSKTQIN